MNSAVSYKVVCNMVRNYAIILLMFISIVPMECVLLKEMCEIMTNFWKSDFYISEFHTSKGLFCSNINAVL